MRRHVVKSWQGYYADTVEGTKSFDVRVNDRGYEVGDELELREWDLGTHEYTGRKHVKRIVYILDAGAVAFGLKPGYCVLGLRPAR